MERTHESSTLVFDEENVYLLLRFRMPLIGFLVQSIHLGCELGVVSRSSNRLRVIQVIFRRALQGGNVNSQIADYTRKIYENTMISIFDKQQELVCALTSPHRIAPQ